MFFGKNKDGKNGFDVGNQNLFYIANTNKTILKILKMFKS